MSDSARPRMLAACCVGAILLAGLSSCSRRAGPAKVRIGQGEWLVELALTTAARQRGLGGRESVPEGTGMLFAFPRTQPVEFHMKDCLVPLDTAFITEDLQVAHIRTMRVEPDPADPRILYPSEAPVRYVLEVAAGQLAQAGVEVGDRVTLLGAARNAAKDAR